MLFDLFLIAKVSIKIEYPNKILLFYRKFMFLQSKIAVCAPKIPKGRKKIKIHIRLKITAESKNYYLKIPVRVCMCTRVRVYACMYVEIEHTTKTGTPTEHTTTEKGRTQAKRKNLFIYVCLQAMKKKYKKS